MFGKTQSVDLCVQAFTSFAEIMENYGEALRSKMKSVNPNKPRRKSTVK